MDFAQSLSSLNSAQHQAVTAPLSNLLVLAGAGSGKTRVLVHRIAWLIIEQGVYARQIFAVTFTNKAASEMRARLSSMLPGSNYGMWVGTFHGLAHKLLCLHAEQAGLLKNFQVIDPEDQLRIVKQIIKQLNIDEERFAPKDIRNYINRKKDAGLRANKLGQLKDHFDHVMADIYLKYEQFCQEQSVVDFAELLLRTYELLNNNQELLQYYQEKFQHFLVDEFQDTNTIQYRWLRLLAANSSSVTVVGDDDQSIYGWRGAEIENIYRFQKEYQDANLIRLEQNYRSTKTILQAANVLIDNNNGRLGKNLWTQQEQGEPITLYGALNEEDEALFVVRQIRMQMDSGTSLQDIAILYRSNAQSRVLEEALMRSGIAYKIHGGLRFFERAEIKDVLAYLKLALNPDDDIAFERVVNMPPRGIGNVSQLKIKIYADNQGLSLQQATKQLLDKGELSGKAKSGLADFLSLITDIDCSSLPAAIEQIISASGLLEYFSAQPGEKARSRVENLEELVNATRDFVDEYDAAADEFGDPILAFLSDTMLDADSVSVSEQQDAIELMTLHTAKGLEYPVVFMCGLEEGLFPHYFSMDSDKGLEEERRLCYVGITRAKRKLFMSYAKMRRLFGREGANRISRFVFEIPAELIDEQSRKTKITPFASYSKSSQEGGFSVGQRVMHSKFGQGTIINNEGYGAKARVQVSFDRAGDKWLVLTYANLETI